MASLMMSAALPCTTVLTACLSASERRNQSELLMVGSRRLRPISVVTCGGLRRRQSITVRSVHLYSVGSMRRWSFRKATACSSEIFDIAATLSSPAPYATAKLVFFAVVRSALVTSSMSLLNTMAATYWCRSMPSLKAWTSMRSRDRWAITMYSICP